MALKPITLRLDEEEYERLKTYLTEFGDPDINVAYVLRAYIRDLNRALPFLLRSGWDLKNYFGLLGSWLKQFGAITDVEMLTKVALNPWALWNRGSSDPERDAQKRVGSDEGERGDSAPADGNRLGEKHET